MAQLISKLVLSLCILGSLLGLIYLTTKGKNKILELFEANFDPEAEDQLTLQGSNLGTLPSFRLQDPTIQQQFREISRNFPLTTRDPLSLSGVEPLPGEAVGPEGAIPLPPSNIAQEDIEKALSQPVREIPQHEDRIPINEVLGKNSPSKSKNRILSFNESINLNIKKALEELIEPLPVDVTNQFQILDVNPNLVIELNRAINEFVVKFNAKLDEVARRREQMETREETQTVFNFGINSAFKLVDTEENQYEKNNQNYTKFITSTFLFEDRQLFFKNIILTLVKSPTGELIILNGKLFGDGQKRIPGHFPGAKPLFDLKVSRKQQEITPELIDSELKKREQRQDINNFLCFGGLFPAARTQNQCVNIGGGVWDRPVKTNEECPMFRSNKNYTNSRGGLQRSEICEFPPGVIDQECLKEVEVNQELKNAFTGGFCEVPFGMNLLGFRNIDPNPKNKALCYNCINGFFGSKSLGDCCEEQLDKIKYPTLTSPDFAFPGDAPQRYAARNQLATRGLAWHRKGPDFDNVPP